MKNINEVFYKEWFDIDVDGRAEISVWFETEFIMGRAILRAHVGRMV